MGHLCLRRTIYIYTSPTTFTEFTFLHKRDLKYIKVTLYLNPTNSNATLAKTNIKSHPSNKFGLTHPGIECRYGCVLCLSGKMMITASVGGYLCTHMLVSQKQINLWEKNSKWSLYYNLVLVASISFHRGVTAKFSCMELNSSKINILKPKWKLNDQDILHLISSSDGNTFYYMVVIPPSQE